ncbi:MAG: hypothetical protein HY232_07555 [Acidobacteria bacterium]|nr:hypothetical protein [Acidobacteriota bacterium]
MRISLPFLLLTTHMAAGILLLLLTISPVVQKSFFRLCALLTAALIVVTMPVRYQPRFYDPRAFTVSCLCLGATLAYLLTLLKDHPKLERNFLLIASTSAIFLSGLDMSTLKRLTGFATSTILLYTSFFFSSLLLGSTMVAMLIGHWYVMDTSMSIAHLKKASTWFAVAVWLRLGLAGGALVYYWAQASYDRQAVVRLIDPLGEGIMLWFRVLIGLLGPLILTFFIARTVNLRATLSATGLFYVAVIFVLFGELLAKYLLTVSYIPV